MNLPAMPRQEALLLNLTVSLLLALASVIPTVGTRAEYLPEAYSRCCTIRNKEALLGRMPCPWAKSKDSGPSR